MFNHNTLEEDIKLLGQEVSERKRKEESKDLSEKEIIKETIRPFIVGTQTSAIAAPSVSANQTILEEDSILPTYLKDSPSEVKLQVEKLIDRVFHAGLAKAASEARKQTPFLLDSFHDALTDKLYEELKKRKLV